MSQARAVAERDRAQGALEATRTALKEEFGVTTPEEIQALLEQLETGLDTEERRVRELLDRAGGGQ